MMKLTEFQEIAGHLLNILPQRIPYNIYIISKNLNTDNLFFYYSCKGLRRGIVFLL